MSGLMLTSCARVQRPELLEKLSAQQRTRVNHCISRELPYEHLLPRPPEEVEVAAQVDDDAESATLGLGKYRLLRKRLLRGGPSLTSAKQGSISKGTVVHVTEQEVVDNSLRCSFSAFYPQTPLDLYI